MKSILSIDYSPLRFSIISHYILNTPNLVSCIG